MKARSIWSESSPILITCPKSLSAYVKDELVRAGFPVGNEDIAAVETAGTMDDAMRINLILRTGHRVLYRLDEFPCAFLNELYGEVVRLPWEAYIPDDGYISVTSSISHPSIKDPRIANLKCKDAIVDRIRNQTGRRPDSGPDREKASVFLFWRKKSCQIYLDTTGPALSHRGYRKIPLKAPLRESLAAACVLSARWDGKVPFVNPMCGSGTIAIEAALIAVHRAPGLLRNNFGFKHLKGFDAKRLDALRKEVRREAAGKDKQCLIIATDRDPKAVEAAKQNARTAGVDHLIQFAVCDFAETEIPPEPGVIMLNPAYGERMGDVEKLEPLYRSIGDFFKQKCTGYRGYVFTGNLPLTKKVGLRARRRLQFYNGRIECRLLEYELY